MRSACPGYMKSKSKMNRQATQARRDAGTQGRREGVSQARVQTVGAPQQNLTAGHIGNTPPSSPYPAQQQKFCLHCEKFWAYLPSPTHCI